MLIPEQLIMNIGKTANGLEITREMVVNSIESFNNMPIVYNKQQKFKDYTENNFENYINEIAIGYIVANTVKIMDNKVFADIMVIDKYIHLWKGKYDNWCINYPANDDKNMFELVSIEVF